VKTILLILTLSILPLLLFGQSSDKKLLIQKIEAVDVEETFTGAVEEALVLNIGSRAGFSVITSGEMKDIASFATTGANFGCEKSKECLVEVQKKLKADLLISGRVAKLGSDYVLSISSIDINSRVVKNRATALGLNLKEIKDKIPETVDTLLGTGTAKKAFKLALDEKLTLAVLPLIPKGTEKTEADSLTQIMAAEINQIEGINVISQDDIKAMLDKVNINSELACMDDVRCVVEIGAAFGAAKLVTGSVGKVKDSYIISLQLIDTRKAEVENRVLESFYGDRNELKYAVKIGVYALFGIDVRANPGNVDFTFNVEKGELNLGDRTVPLENSHYENEAILPGRYTLKVIPEDEDYIPLNTDIYIAPGATNVRSFNLLEKPVPWYKSWWFWTSAGVVITATAGTIYVLTSDQPPGEGDAVPVPEP